jgi:transcriptional antiterminator NusG
MTFFVVQVGTGDEERFLRRARQELESVNPVESARMALWWPRRSIRIRRGGRWRESLASIFPGYLFLEGESVSPEIYWRFKSITGFRRFLKDNHNIEPVGPRDRAIIQHFISCGEIVHRSTVVFDEHNRIRVISGPLKGLEGRIIKVDRRKGRARVKLELYEDSFTIDFGFDSLERADRRQ